MKKSELVAALRAATAISKETDFYLIGSQAVHAHCKKAPAGILLSQECDLYPRNLPQLAGLLASALGPNSDFATSSQRPAGIMIQRSQMPSLATRHSGW